MADSYTDTLRSLLGGIWSVGNNLISQGRNAQMLDAPTWQGIERSTETPFRNLSARIQLSGTAVAASQQQEGAFVRAARQEWATAVQDWQRQYERDILYYTGKQWLKAYGDLWDPDMEMDIGL